jgi:Carboxypeptidase regulatory-like domain
MLRTSFRGGCIGVFICFLLFCTALSLAQTGTTSLHGSVIDKSGAAIAGAKVTISDTAHAYERTTTSGETGQYDFHGLPPGSYTVIAEKENFQKFQVFKLELLVNLPATLDITLQVGASTETVEVSAQAVTLNTSDASLGNAFNENQVKSLPMEGRNVPDLLSLQPGVAYTNNRPDVPTWDTRNGAVNGARSDQANVTVDGISANSEGGEAFTSVLPVTLDSVQEFRVSTSNYNADEGSSSGAQVAMVTKSGTNQFHGSAYEYNRNTLTSANDFFVKNAQIQTCLDNGTPLTSGSCNQAPKLIRNIFGGSVGGPIKKDRFYFFLNYEGVRRSEAQSVTNAVPSEAMKDGIIQYQCQALDNGDLDTATCPGGSVAGKSGASYNVQPGYAAVSPTQLTAMDPLHNGPSQAVLDYLNTFPKPNCSNAGDGYNYSCFNFSGPISDTANIYIAKLDYNLTRDGKHRVSVSGAMRTEANAQAPFLPGQPPSQSIVNFNKGIIVNYSAAITNTLINNFRYGYIRESDGVIGNSYQDWIYFRGLNDQTGAVTRTHSLQRPINNFVDDVTWIKGRHTLQFGGQLAFARTPSQSYNTSYSDGIANASWTTLAGYAAKKSPLNPAYTCANSSSGSCVANGNPFVDAGFANSYDFPVQALLGMVTEVDAAYNFTRDGTALPDGAPTARRYALNSYEMYFQDIWKVKPSFTLTLGLRYSLFSPPWETNKLQVAPTVNLGDWYQLRSQEGLNGVASLNDPAIGFNWSGPANNGPNYYNWDYKNLGPRIAFAWAPRMNSGLLGDALGEGKTSIRGGFSMVYDRFGQGVADDFAENGSFGLSTSLTNPAGFLSPYDAPRLTSVNTIPTQDLNGNTIFLPPPPATFPQVYPDGTFAIAHSIDAGLKTPYALTFDLSVARELKGGFTLEVNYVGRLGRRLLTQLDPATPLNLKDKTSGVDYFTATTALAKLYRQASQGGQAVTDATFNNSMLPANVVAYWQKMMQPLQPGGSYALGSSGGCGNGPGATTNPVLAAFDLFCGGNLNETTPLLIWDYSGIPDGNNNAQCGNPGFPSCVNYFPSPGGGQPYSFYNPQYATLYMWRSMGNSNYNAMQIDLKHNMAHGVQFGFTYTLSKSIDLSSDAERVGTIGGTGAQIQNAWSPYQFRAVSDFDATHQITANWVVDLPFGRGKEFGRDVNGIADAFIGGWQLSGLARWTSGFPFSVGNGYNWATDWDLSGNGIQVAPVKTGTYYNPANQGEVNAFSNFSDGANSFIEPYPGNAGQRNTLRGPGFFSVDMGLSKRWKMPWSEGQSLQLRWDVFNVTNSKRFDALSLNSYLDVYGSSFGDYTRLSTKPRVMQFALRYEF